MDAVSMIAIAAMALGAVAIVAFVGLRAFGSWLDYKRAELAVVGQSPASPVTAGARIEVADLKERIRKLEAIAAGVEL